MSDRDEISPEIKPINKQLKRHFGREEHLKASRSAAMRSLTRQKTVKKHPFNPQCFLSVSAGSLFVLISSFIKERTHTHRNRYRRTHSAFDWPRAADRDLMVLIVAGRLPIRHCSSSPRDSLMLSVSD